MGSTALEVFFVFWYIRGGLNTRKARAFSNKIEAYIAHSDCSDCSEFIVWKLRVLVVFFVVSNIKHSC